MQSSYHMVERTTGNANLCCCGVFGEVPLSQPSRVDDDRPDRLAPFFAPRVLAVIGASADCASLSGRPLRMLDRHGYAGRIYLVNPNHAELDGRPVYASIGEVPETVDLAAICVPAHAVPGVVAECGAAGCRAVMVLSSGFAEAGAEGRELEDHVLRIARSYGMDLLGPNSEGFYNAADRVALSFSPALDVDPVTPVPAVGGIGIVSQSGGLGFAAMTAARGIGLDIRYVTTTGNEADIDACRLAAYMIENLDVTVVAMILEGLDEPAQLKRLARHAQDRAIRLVVVKLGASDAGSRAVARHTARAAGRDDLYQAVFDQHGILRAHDEDEFLDQLSVLSRSQPMPAGRRVGIVTSSGGAGVWLADCCEANGFDVPELSAATQQVLSDLMPPYGSSVNPVDITAQAVANGRFTPTAAALAASGEVDAVLISTSLSSPSRVAREADALSTLLATAAVPILLFTYTVPAPECVQQLAELGLPWFPSPSRTARALAALHGTTRPAAPPLHTGPALPAELDGIVEHLRATGISVEPVPARPVRVRVGLAVGWDDKFGSHLAARVLDGSAHWARSIVGDRRVERGDAEAVIHQIGVDADLDPAASQAVVEVLLAASVVARAHRDCVEELRLDAVAVSDDGAVAIERWSTSPRHPQAPAGPVPITAPANSREWQCTPIERR